MSYTYIDPASGVFNDQISNVRYLVEDTVPAGPFSLSDGEIQVEIAATTILDDAAANVAQKMARRYGKESVTSKSVGNLSLSRSYQNSATTYLEMARDLRSGSAHRAGAVTPIFTGFDIPQQFSLGQHDDPPLYPGLDD